MTWTSIRALLASSGKRLVVLLSRKPIPTARRKLLAERLGAGGGIKYFTGQCLLESDATTFVLQPQVAGLGKRIRAALREQTGLRVKEVCCRGEGGP